MISRLTPFGVYHVEDGPLTCTNTPRPIAIYIGYLPGDDRLPEYSKEAWRFVVVEGDVVRMVYHQGDRKQLSRRLHKARECPYDTNR